MQDDRRLASKGKPGDAAFTVPVYGARLRLRCPFTVPGFGYSVSESGTRRNNSADVQRPVLEGLARQLEITEIPKPGTQGPEPAARCRARAGRVRTRSERISRDRPGNFGCLRM